FEDTSKELTQSGKISFIIPFKGSDKRQLVLPVEEKNKINDNHNTPLFWIRCRSIVGDYEVAPRIDAILPNAISAKYGTTVRESLVNVSNDYKSNDYKSNGLPGQVFEVLGDGSQHLHTPIIEPLLLYTVHMVDGQDVYCMKWQE